MRIPLLKGTRIQYRGIEAEVFYDEDGDELIVEVDDNIYEKWLWVFEDIECEVING